MIKHAKIENFWCPKNQDFYEIKIIDDLKNSKLK